MCLPFPRMNCAKSRSSLTAHAWEIPVREVGARILRYGERERMLQGGVPDTTNLGLCRGRRVSRLDL